MLIFVIGGPAANLMSAAAIVVLVRYVFPSSADTWVAPFAAGFAYFSLFLALVSLLPLLPNSRSDGARIWMLLTSYNRTRRLISALALASQTRRGVPLKFWKKSWLRTVASIRDASFDEFTANWIAFLAASSRKEAPEAAAHLERCLELAHALSIVKRDELAREAAIFTAWFRCDVVGAEKWLAQMKHPKQTTRIMQLRMRVALDSARADYESAFSGLHEGAVFIDALPETPFKVMLKESWQEWEGEIQGRKNEMTSV